MPAASYDITIEQGATFHLSARFGTLLVDQDGNAVLDDAGNRQIDVPRDFTDCTFRMQVRGHTKHGAVMFTVTSEDVDGGISAENGTVTIEVPDELTDLVTKDGFWDLKCYNTDDTEDRLLEGTVTADLATTTDAA